MITQGLIILLHKKGIPTMLQNKRPLTLLNSVYKIFTKLFQLRLSPILQKLISANQSAFLPGRSIHHSILLTNELLHLVRILGEDFIFLKLDMVKAFDKVDWKFLYALLRKLGFGDKFVKFVLAITASANSKIVVNGRTTRAIEISRSVRQGCPLSSLLFIIVMECLDKNLQKALEIGRIEGIQLREEALHLMHRIYADDINLILRASFRNILQMQEIFYAFGRVSGLKCDWEKSPTTFISNSVTLPPEIAALPWKWENNLNASKLLDYHIGEEISPELTKTQLKTALNLKLKKVSSFPGTLMARVLYINHMLLGSLWYLLTLWTGDQAYLLELERSILNFLWAGSDTKTRNRVDKATVYLSKAKGGLGVISIMQQVNALAGKFILWATSTGDHPLQLLLRRQISSLTEKKWGVPGVAWVYNPCTTLPVGTSKAMLNIFKAWKMTKSNCLQVAACNYQEFLHLPLWTPCKAHRIQKLVGCKTKTARALFDAGIQSMGDITDREGQPLPWEGQTGRGLPRVCKLAYEKLLRNMDVQFLANEIEIKPRLTFFAAQSTPASKETVWACPLRAEQRLLQWSTETAKPIATVAYKRNGNRLCKIPVTQPDFDAKLHRVLVCKTSPNSKTEKLEIVGSTTEEIGLSIHHCWKDGLEIYHSTTAHRRRIQAPQ